MASVVTAGAAVARIAYVASHVVVSVQPSLASDSEFSKHLRALANSKTPSAVAKSRPEIIPVRQNADPLLSALQTVRSGKITAVTMPSSILLNSVPRLYKLAQYPVVVHVALEPFQYPDYSTISSIRQTGFTFLESHTLQEVQDMALSAHALSIKLGKGVIHFFNAASIDRYDPIPQPSLELVHRLLDSDSARRFQASGSVETSLYADDGRQASLIVPASSSTLEDGKSKGENAFTNETSKALPKAVSANGSSSGSSVRESGSSFQSIASSITSVESIISRPVTSDDTYNFLTQIWETIRELTGRVYRPFEYSGPANARYALFVFGADPALFTREIEAATSSDQYAGVAVITPRLYRPWLGARLASTLPQSIERIAVLEQVRRKTTKWGPLLLDILMSLRGSGQGPLVVGCQLGYLESSTVPQALCDIFQNVLLQSPVQNFEVGRQEGPTLKPSENAPEQPALENAYMKILRQLFGEQLYVANQLGSGNAGVSPDIAASPEYGFGSLVARAERRKRFIQNVQEAVKRRGFLADNLQKSLSNWVLVAEDGAKTNALAPEVITRLTTDNSPFATSLLPEKAFFFKESQWLIGSDAWAYDLGNSGVHHVLASGANLNMLIIDSQPYSDREATDASRRKKDIGLYAMNFGNAYVASVAVYSSYTQVLSAMLEAEQFNGPSVVLAYLPYYKETDTPVAVLQETKKAVDSGFWPLYRWNPQSAEDKGEERFVLDSERVKKELEEFLRRDNYLTQLTKRHPEFSSNLSGSYGSEVRALQKRRAKDAYGKLLEGLAGAPLTILFASDNGNAENLAKRMGNRGKARGLKTIVMAMDDYPLEDLSSEENVVFIASTAGQGEFPQNGRQTWETIRNSTDFDLATVNFAVFGLGDSHYWPRKEDKVYYNKPAKDLHAKLVALGGKPLTELGLGDDQDPDTYQTGYAEWEPKLWKALGVDNVEGLPEEPPPLTNEDIKIASNYLRGTIAEGLMDDSTGAISANDQQLTKFHGTYMQDDRDLRDERKAQGLEPAYSFMIRCRLPGGVATPDQWLKMDAIATNLGNHTMKLTTRQTFQFHGVVKGKLRPAMQAINRALMTTIAACGDVSRNVMCSTLPTASKYHKEVLAVAKRISDHLLPNTTAYHEIWLSEDGGATKTQVAGNAIVDHEPLYGPTYLPRKFKITIAVPPHNDTDVYAHDVGLIAIKSQTTGSLKGFNVLAGGGMGMTHNNQKTYPQIGRMLGYVPATEVHNACEKIMLVQRDHGDRKNRKHARLKYTIDDMGLDVFREKVEELLGWRFAKSKPFRFESNVDTFGWQRDELKMNHFTFFIENGRIEDTPEFQMKTGLRRLSTWNVGEFRLTPNQHLILANVPDAALSKVKGLLKRFKLDNTDFSALRLSSSACVAFPTCGLAMAESERYLPELITKLEGVVEETGLRHDSIVFRMTGCPNGCARPWLAEAAFVGKAYGVYNLYLGGGYHGQRLNKLYRSSIKEDEILEIMKPMIRMYAKDRLEGERFGDWTIRAGYIKATREGRDFHEDTAEVESDEG